MRPIPISLYSDARHYNLLMVSSYMSTASNNACAPMVLWCQLCLKPSQRRGNNSHVLGRREFGRMVGYTILTANEDHGRGTMLRGVNPEVSCTLISSDRCHFVRCGTHESCPAPLTMGSLKYFEQAFSTHATACVSNLTYALFAIRSNLSTLTPWA